MASTFNNSPKGAKLLVHGKGSDYEINLSAQTVEILNTYIMARGRINGDVHGEPLIATVSKWGTTGHKRIGRSAISKETEKLLHAAGIKEQPGKGPHALRYTCGHLIWNAHQFSGQSALAVMDGLCNEVDSSRFERK